MNPHLTKFQNPVLALDVDRRTHHITLTTLSPEGVEQLGTFPSVAAAWEAIDAVDCAVR